MTCCIADPGNNAEAERSLDLLFRYVTDMEKKLVIEYDRAVPSLYDIYTLGMEIHVQPFTAEEHEILQPFHQYVRSIYGIQEKLVQRNFLISRDHYQRQTNEILIPNYQLTEEQQKVMNDLVTEAAIMAKDKYDVIVELFNETETRTLFDSIEENKLKLTKVLYELTKESQEAQEANANHVLEHKGAKVTEIGEISKMLLEQIESETWRLVMEKIDKHIDDIIANQKEFPMKIILAYV